MSELSKIDIGRLGEEEAVRFLKKKGYKILECNWIFRKKEVDIIASTPEYIIFIEVKTRTEGFLESPQEAVTLKKQRFIITAANFYIEKYAIDKEVRLDIVSVVLDKNQSLLEMEHIENAYYPKVARVR
jgi:putative endonuclease